MKERPILFRPELVRQIRQGQKTHTMRIYKNARSIPEVGDILWVRETWKRTELEDGYEYKADHLLPYLNIVQARHGLKKYKPSIHMPKDACRLWLYVSETRHGQIQSIFRAVPNLYLKEGLGEMDQFIELWDQLHPDLPFESNPLVHMIKFHRMQQKPESWK